MKKDKQIKAVRAFNMFKKGLSDEEILEVCSKSTLKKVKTYYNNRVKNGQELVLNGYPEKSKKYAEPIKDEKCFSSGGIIEKSGLNSILSAVKLPLLDGEKIVKKDSTNDFKESLFGKTNKKEIKSSEVKTLDDLIKFSNIDIDNYYCSNFISGVYGSRDHPAVQCKGIFKPKVRGGLSPKEMAEEFKELIKNTETKTECRARKTDYSDNVAIIPIADLHFGARASAQETGDEYNLEIAKDTLMESVNFHLNNIMLHNVEKIILPILGDFFNIDTVNSTTTRGTYQEETTSWKKTFREGCALLIRVINLLQEFAPVKVYVCNGNHDEIKTFQLQCFLEGYYKDSSVMIDSSDTVRKYYSYGNSLFGFGHGDTKANVDYLGIMSTEVNSDVFACGKYRTMIIGHLHHKTTEEKPGIIIRRVGSLNACNTWHKKKGYESLRSSEGYIVSKANGIVNNSTFYV